MTQLISTDKTFAMLEKFSIPLTDFKIVKNKAYALRAASQIGFPIAVKLLSKKIIHKSDSGAVKININNKEKLETAIQELETVAKNNKVKPEGVPYSKNGKKEQKSLSD